MILSYHSFVVDIKSMQSFIKTRITNLDELVGQQWYENFWLFKVLYFYYTTKQSSSCVFFNIFSIVFFFFPSFSFLNTFYVVFYRAEAKRKRRFLLLLFFSFFLQSKYSFLSTWCVLCILGSCTAWCTYFRAGVSVFVGTVGRFLGFAGWLPNTHPVTAASRDLRNIQYLTQLGVSTLPHYTHIRNH